MGFFKLKGYTYQSGKNKGQPIPLGKLVSYYKLPEQYYKDFERFAKKAGLPYSAVDYKLDKNSPTTEREVMVMKQHEGIMQNIMQNLSHSQERKWQSELENKHKLDIAAGKPIFATETPDFAQQVKADTAMPEGQQPLHQALLDDIKRLENRPVHSANTSPNFAKVSGDPFQPTPPANTLQAESTILKAHTLPVDDNAKVTHMAKTLFTEYYKAIQEDAVTKGIPMIGKEIEALNNMNNALAGAGFPGKFSMEQTKSGFKITLISEITGKTKMMDMVDAISKNFTDPKISQDFAKSLGSLEPNVRTNALQTLMAATPDTNTNDAQKESSPNLDDKEKAAAKSKGKKNKGSKSDTKEPKEKPDQPPKSTDGKTSKSASSPRRG